MKIIKLIFKISVCWALTSLTIGLVEMLFTADSIAFQITGGVWALALIISLILIVRIFLPPKHTFTMQPYYNACRQLAVHSEWTRYQTEQQQKNKRTNATLFGLFVLMISVFAFAKTLRKIK